VLAGGGPSAAARARADSAGVVFARTSRFRTGENNLVPQKARLLLMLARAFSDDPKQVTAWFDHWSALEFRPIPAVQQLSAAPGAVP